MPRNRVVNYNERQGLGRFFDIAMEDHLNQTEPAPPQEPASKPSGLFSALSWIRDLAFSVLIAVILIVFIYQPVKVEGTSMMPTLTNEERIFINKFNYQFGIGNIQRGDMVVFLFPGDTTKSYIKRVIGLPGDDVAIDRGQVVLNGKPLAESYVPEDYRDHVSYSERTVPPGNYFVLGDHRSSSNDSRNWGYVDRKFIYGKAVFVYWPLDKMGRLR
jgi:signal peptidase I